MLFNDGDYHSSETPAQKISMSVMHSLWQAIDRDKLSHPFVNDDEMPDATAEQACVHTYPKGCQLALLAVLSQALCVTRRLRMWLSGLPRWAGERTG